LCWSPFIKSQIASSDYDGIVSLWDVGAGELTHRLDEHSKRVWSIDFSPHTPTVLASGSDDSTVKLWCTSQRAATTTIESKTNVCCVKFNPNQPDILAFGSAGIVPRPLVRSRFFELM